MQNKRIKNGLKATIFSLIVAILIIIFIGMVSIKLGKEKFLLATDLIDVITIAETKEEEKIAPVLQQISQEEPNNESAILTNCPSYGENYATLKIESIGVELPIYYGKTLDLLKKGIGHDNDSYFPGEGGSVILMGHNFGRFLANLPKVKVGDQIQVTTNYGEFHYTVYDAQVVNENEVDKVPIQEAEERLMIYTCWPINNIGYATERYVVYAK